MAVDAEPAARARVEGRQQHEAGGQREDAIHARDEDGARVDRATQRVDRIGPELERLVKKEDAAMREAGLAGTHSWTAADERLRRDRVVRSAEGWPRRDRSPGVGDARHRVDATHFGGLLLGEWRQEPGAGPRKERLADAGRADEGEVVAPGHRDLQRPTPDRLADHRGEIRRVLARRMRVEVDRGLESLEQLAPREVADDLAEACRRTHDDAANRGALRPVLDGDDRIGDARAAGRRDERHRAGDRSQRAVERQLADERDAPEVRLELAGCDEDGRGHGQVVAGPLFRQIGRGQVDGDPAGGDFEAGVAKGGAHTLACLEHRAAGQADDRQAGKPERDVDLDAHGHAIDPDDRCAERIREHGHALRGRRSDVNPRTVPAACLLASLLTSGDRRSQRRKRALTRGLARTYRGRWGLRLEREPLPRRRSHPSHGRTC